MKTAIAIPDSSLMDESTKLEKTRKISVIARICSIFCINEILIYRAGDADNPDRSLLSTILKYLETPQYFRRILYDKSELLKFVGVSYPLKIPSHSIIKDPKKIKSGDIREGLVVNFKKQKFVDVGINHLFPYFGKEKIGKRIPIQFKNGYPKLSIKEISKDQTQEYWGYKVIERGNLLSTISSWNGNIILTSRKGHTIKKSNIEWISKDPKPLLVVFGSPERGLHDFLGNKITKIKNSKILNLFPNQGTETVRLEEAMMGTLSILNIVKTGYI